MEPSPSPPTPGPGSIPAAASLPTLGALVAHADFLHRIARGLLRDEHRANDVVQEAYRRALEHPPRHADRLGAWLGRVVRNLARNELRSASRRHGREARAARAEALPAAAEIAAREAVRRQVMEAVLELESPYREVVLMRYYEDRAPREISRALQRPVETVRTQLKRGLSRLQERLDEEHGGEREAWALALAPFALRKLRALTATALVGPLALVLLAAGSAAWLTFRSDSSAKRTSAAALAPLARARADGSAIRPEPSGSPAGRSTLEVEAHAPPVERARAADPNDLEALTGLMERLQNYQGFGMGSKPTGPGIRGRVLDASGAAAQGAVVTLVHTARPEIQASARAGARGEYFLHNLPSGTYALRAFAVGQGATEVAGIEVTEGADTNVPDAVVASPGTLAGKLVLPDGTPAAELWVAAAHAEDDGFELFLPTTSFEPRARDTHHATRPGGHAYGWAQTDAQGRYAIAGLPEGAYRLQLVAPARFLDPEAPTGRTGAGELGATVEAHRLWASTRTERKKRVLATYHYALWRDAPPRLFDELPREVGGFDALPEPAHDGYFYHDRPLCVRAGDVVLVDAHLDEHVSARQVLRIEPDDWNARLAFTLAPMADTDWATLTVEVVGAEAAEAVTRGYFIQSVMDRVTGTHYSPPEPFPANKLATTYRVRPGTHGVRVSFGGLPPGEDGPMFLPLGGTVSVASGARETVRYEPAPAGRIALTLEFPELALGTDTGRMLVIARSLADGTETETHVMPRNAGRAQETLHGPLAPGAYVLRVESEDYANVELAVDVVAHRVARVSGRLTPR